MGWGKRRVTPPDALKTYKPTAFRRYTKSKVEVPKLYNNWWQDESHYVSLRNMETAMGLRPPKTFGKVTIDNEDLWYDTDDNGVREKPAVRKAKRAAKAWSRRCGGCGRRPA